MVKRKSKTRPPCAAKQYGDQMICEACGLNWDTNDQDPPECGGHKARKISKRPVGIPMPIGDDLPKVPAYRAYDLPAELPLEISAAMGKAYDAATAGTTNANRLASRDRGIRAAYRVLLDWVTT